MRSELADVVLTFGTFDVFHYGHLMLLKRAKELGNRLIVGVSSDELNFEKKGRAPVYPLCERLELIKAIGAVDDVFIEESLEAKRQYLLYYQANTLVMGDDWNGKLDQFSDICKVVYLPRTPSVSTTAIIEKIQSS